MKIVLGCEVRNPYVHQLVGALDNNIRVRQVENSLSKFWHLPEDVDIIHIQWPGALFRWDEPNEWELAWLQDRLQAWSSQATIVATVHNYCPHHYNSKRSEKLYQLVYSFAEGIIHLGEVSKEHFHDRYGFAEDKHHAVIEHGNYKCFPNEVSRSRAREELGLGEVDHVGLSFGEIRHPEEREVLLEGFGKANKKRKRLLIAGRLPWPSKRRLQYWRLKWDPRIALHEGWIPAEEVQTYCNAADYLVIPRDGSLNSGNVALGFTFGVPVLGPDEGVIGEMLRATGNPVYEPGNPDSLAEAIESINGREAALRERNHQYARKNMRWGDVADAHVSFYEKMYSTRLKAYSGSTRRTVAQA